MASQMTAQMMTPEQAMLAHEAARNIETYDIGSVVMNARSDQSEDLVVDPSLENHRAGGGFIGEWFHFRCMVVGHQRVRICPAQFRNPGYLPKSIGGTQIRIRLAPFGDSEEWYTCYAGTNQFTRAKDLENYGKSGAAIQRPENIPARDIRSLADTGELPPQGFHVRQQWDLARAASSQAVPRQPPPAPVVAQPSQWQGQITRSLPHRPVVRQDAHMGTSYPVRPREAVATSQQQQQQQPQPFVGFQMPAFFLQQQPGLVNPPVHFQAQDAFRPLPVPPAQKSAGETKTCLDNVTGRNGTERNEVREVNGKPKRGRPSGVKDSQPRKKAAPRVTKETRVGRGISPQEELARKRTALATISEHLMMPRGRTPEGDVNVAAYGRLPVPTPQPGLARAAPASTGYMGHPAEVPSRPLHAPVPDDTVDPRLLFMQPQSSFPAQPSSAVPDVPVPEADEPRPEFPDWYYNLDRAPSNNGLTEMPTNVEQEAEDHPGAAGVMPMENGAGGFGDWGLDALGSSEAEYDILDADLDAPIEDLFSEYPWENMS